MFIINLYIDYYEIVFAEVFSQYIITINFYLLFFSTPVYVLKQVKIFYFNVYYY